MKPLRKAVLVAALIALSVVLADLAWAAPEGYGHVRMKNACAPAVQDMLQGALAKLHDFEAGLDDFAAVLARDGQCSLAAWGAAMSARGNPLAGGLDDAALKTGRRWVDKAMSLQTGLPETRALIAALDVYYRPYADGHAARTAAYEAAMTRVYQTYPDEPDIAAFAALAMLEAVDLRDTTYARQRKAGAILESVWAAHPDHPGAPHYLIHAYDYPALAEGATHAATSIRASRRPRATRSTCRRTSGA